MNGSGHERPTAEAVRPVGAPGALGGAKVLLFRRHNPDPDGPHWSLFVTERTHPQERLPAHDAQRGVATGAAIDERADAAAERVFGSKVDRDAHVAELAARFQPDEEIPFRNAALSLPSSSACPPSWPSRNAAAWSGGEGDEPVLYLVAAGGRMWTCRCPRC
jgi:hypothetical protein